MGDILFTLNGTHSKAMFKLSDIMYIEKTEKFIGITFASGKDILIGDNFSNTIECINKFYEKLSLYMIQYYTTCPNNTCTHELIQFI